MTQVWPGFGEAPVPTVVSIICKPDAVVMGFPGVWANAPDGAAKTRAPAIAKASMMGEFRKRRIFSSFLSNRVKVAVRSISQRAAVLARIGTAGQRALVPVDPDRLAAAERPDHARRLVPELLQALDDGGRHAVLELIDALVVQATGHIDPLLHVAAIVEHVGQHMALADRLILPAHHAERHLGAAILGDEARNDRVQRPFSVRDAVGMAVLHAETAGAVL